MSVSKLNTFTNYHAAIRLNVKLKRKSFYVKIQSDKM